MGRYEIKYLIPERERAVVLSRVAARMRPDPHGSGSWGGYAVHSLYLDSPQLFAYQEKVDGVGLREKIRLRTYGLGGGPCFLELKQRRQEHIVKHKLCLDEGRQARILRGLPLLAGEAHPAVAAYNRQVAAWGIQPKVLITYRREAFVSSLPGNLRFTVDTEVRVGAARNWEQALGAQYRIWPAGWAVAEVKFERLLPEWVTQLVRVQGWTPRSVSKFCAGIDWLLGAGLLTAGVPVSEPAGVAAPARSWQEMAPSPA